MCSVTPDYEIRIKGHALLKISNGAVKIDGKDFHSDLKNLSSLIEILSGVLDSAQEVKKPKIVASENAAPVAQIVPFPYKVISSK